jgi:Spy/CpxP family protein refolding chaperone
MKLKSLKNSLIAAVALSALVAGSLAGSAQTTNSNAGAGQGEKVDQFKEHLRKVAEELQLTEAQKGEIKPILKAEFEKLKELRANTSLTPKERREQRNAIREDLAAKLKSILTPEQFTKWEQLRAQEREEWRGKKQAAN